MEAIPTKVTGSEYLALEFEKGSVREVQNIIQSTGVALNGADLFQLSKAVSEYVAGSDFYVEGGGSAADAYVLQAIGSKESPTQLFDGLRLIFRVANTNTGASTCALPGLAAKTLKKDNGSSDLVAGDLTTSSYVEFRYDLSNDYFVLQNTSPISIVSASNQRGVIDGLIMSNGVDTDHDINMDVGAARDAADSQTMVSSSIITKQIDANWAVGTSVGGFPSALTLTADTWYHYFIIAKSDGTVDAGFDSSLSATNLLADATGYTQYRRVGSVLVDASSNILQFIQVGDYFYWDVVPLDFAGAPGATAQTITLSTPPGAKCLAYLNIEVSDGGTFPNVYVSSLDQSDQGTTVGAAPLYTTGSRTANSSTGSQAEVMTNTSSQVRTRLRSGGTSQFIVTLGWQDFRGKE